MHQKAVLEAHHWTYLHLMAGRKGKERGGGWNRSRERGKPGKVLAAFTCINILNPSLSMLFYTLDLCLVNSRCRSEEPHSSDQGFPWGKWTNAHLLRGDLSNHLQSPLADTVCAPLVRLHQQGWGLGRIGLPITLNFGHPKDVFQEVAWLLIRSSTNWCQWWHENMKVPNKSLAHLALYC